MALSRWARRRLLDELIGEAEQALDVAKEEYDDSIDAYAVGERDNLDDNARAKWFHWRATVEWLKGKRECT